MYSEDNYKEAGGGGGEDKSGFREAGCSGALLGDQKSGASLRLLGETLSQ